MYMCAQLVMKRCLGADGRNPDRHGRALIQASIVASVTPRSHLPPQGSTAGMTIYLYQGPGRQQKEEEEEDDGQVLLHMPGGMAGASHGGILLKVRQADLPVTSAWGRYRACIACVSVCEERERRGSLWALVCVRDCVCAPLGLCVQAYTVHLHTCDV